MGHAIAGGHLHGVAEIGLAGCRRDRQRGRDGARLAQDVIIRIAGKGQIIAKTIAIGRRIIIARGAAHNDPGVLQIGENSVGITGVTCIGIRKIGESAHRTEAHIDHIDAQHHAVLQSGQDIRPLSGTVGAKNLHHNKLRIGRRAGKCDSPLRVHRIARGDAGHMGAVVCLIVLIVIHICTFIRIIKTERNFSTKVHTACKGTGIRAAQQLICIQLSHFHRGQRIAGDGLAGGCICKRLMVGINAGIDHGNDLTRTGIAGGGTTLIDGEGRGILHGAVKLRVRGDGRVDGVNIDVGNAAHAGNLVHLIDGGIHCQRIGQQGVVIDHIHPRTSDHTGEGGLHSRLLRLDTHLRTAGCGAHNAGRGEALRFLPNDRSTLQLHDHAHPIVPQCRQDIRCPSRQSVQLLFGQADARVDDPARQFFRCPACVILKRQFIRGQCV